MDSDLDLQALMARYQQGDASAAAALVHSLSPQLHRFFLIQFVSRRHADDLLQETWLRIHEIRHTYRRGEPVRPWIYAIARNIRVDHFRKAHRAESLEQPLSSDADVPLPPDAGPYDALPSRGALDWQALLAALPDSQREIIVMLKVADMSLEDVARATGSTVGSVKQKAHRAYDKLRKALGGRTTAPREILDEG